MTVHTITRTKKPEAQVHRVSVIVATHGDRKWAALAEERAAPTVEGQGALETIVLHDDDATLAGARNAAAAYAVGDWLCFVDADDELAPGYLAAMRVMMRYWNLSRAGDLRLNPLLLVPAVEYLHAGGATVRAGIPDWDRSLIDVNCAVVGTLIPRFLFWELGGFHELSSLEDWEFFLRCVEAGARMVPVRDAVYRVHVGHGSRNSDQSPYQAIRAEHQHGFDWANISAYKVER